MKKMTAAAKKAALWAAYETTMRAARAAALAFADALEAYLRRIHRIPGEAFIAATVAADRYMLAVEAARPYHFGAIRVYSSSDVINLEPFKLLEIMRELRGSQLPIAAAVVYADNGIAGFFALELRSMRRFGSPRRSPTEADARAAAGGWAVAA